MQFTIRASIQLVLVLGGAAHNTFPHLLINGTVTQEWKYVRDVAPAYDGVPLDYAKMIPMMDIYSPEMTCGRNGFAAAPKTETADIIAGEPLGFRISNAYPLNVGSHATIVHPGPAQLYLSKPPKGDLKTYKGDGDWFKIASITAESDSDWALWPDKTDVNFTIPKTTPPGPYLLRIEQFMPTDYFNYSQWYINCAHVNIIGPGGGNPAETAGMAKFPGTYDIMDPGIWVTQNVNNYPYTKGLMAYKPPGPAVWQG